MHSVFKKIMTFLEMIKFSHTIFALPFALSAALLASGGFPGWRKTLLIIVAMAGARTAAMSLNRLIDADIDAKNPRTSSRAIPAGLLSKASVLAAAVVSLGVMVVAALFLNPLCLKLSPVAIFFLFLYSYCKRFTSMAHIVLGICLAAAPIGAWMALTGEIPLPAILIGLMVLFWVAGFDVLYALQDFEYDRGAGLHSIPVRFGINGSLWIARGFHILTVMLLGSVALSLNLGGWFISGAAVMTAMLFYEQWLLRNGDLSKLDAAFFTMNGYISLTFLGATALEVFTRG